MRDEVPQIETAARDLTAYVAGLLAGRRAVPRDDFLTSYATAVHEAGNLSPIETLVQIIQGRRRSTGVISSKGLQQIIDLIFDRQLREHPNGGGVTEALLQRFEIQLRLRRTRLGGRSWYRSGSTRGDERSRKVERAMHEMKRGRLKSGRSGKTVTNRKQAIAIGLSEARKSGAKIPKKKKSSGKK